MGVFMPHGFVAVPVRMRLGYRPVVDMLMMLIMNVCMLVSQRLVGVFVVVAFGQMEPQAHRHQQAGSQELEGHRLTE